MMLRCFRRPRPPPTSEGLGVSKLLLQQQDNTWNTSMGENKYEDGKFGKQQQYIGLRDLPRGVASCAFLAAVSRILHCGSPSEVLLLLPG